MSARLNFSNVALQQKIANSIPAEKRALFLGAGKLNHLNYDSAPDRCNHQRETESIDLPASIGGEKPQGLFNISAPLMPP
jgi:hypothetical protein